MKGRFHFSISQILSLTTLTGFSCFIIRRIAEEAHWDYQVFGNGLRVGFYPFLLLFNIHRDLCYTCDYSAFCALGFFVGLVGTTIFYILLGIGLWELAKRVFGK